MSIERDGDTAAAKGNHLFSGYRICDRDYDKLPDSATLARYVEVGAVVVCVSNGREGARYTWNGTGLVLDVSSLRGPSMAKTKPGATVAVRRVG